MTAWVAPTFAAIHWRTQAVAWAAAAVAALVVRGHGEPLITLFTAAVLASSSGLVGVALDDDARDLLAAVPAGPRRRLLQRLAFVLPAALGGAATVLLLAAGSIAGATVATLIALVLSAVAAFSVAARIAPTHAPAAAATFAALWLACALPLADHRWPAALATLWTDQPLAVMCCAAGVIAVVLDV